jgi:GAF domain
MSKNDSQSAAGPAPTPEDFDYLLEQPRDVPSVCVKIATLFAAKPDEVALYKLDKGFLRFLFPGELKTAGAIPLSGTAAVSAHTASSKRAEVFNNFVKVKHASVFEHVKRSRSGDDDVPVETAPIQKLLSAPIVDEGGDVVGVIQVSRKGADLASSGPDFSLDDLRRLEVAAKVLSRASFMQAG